MSTLRYKTNLNCGNCVAAVKPFLDGDPAIRRWSVDTADPNKILTIEADRISPDRIRQHVASAGFQVLGLIEEPSDRPQPSAVEEPSRSFLDTYRPIVLVFSYLIGLVALVEILAGSFDWMRAMAHFMGGFFLAFSFFKFLNLRGFVDAYQTYDIVARPFRAYGYIYPFIELGLGIAYVARFSPVLTNSVTLIVMSVSMIGVTQALLQKRKIQCACLGTVFNLPMSKVTFLEDALMAGMAAVKLLAMLI